MLRPAHRCALVTASALAIAAALLVAGWAFVGGLSGVRWIIGRPPACSYARAHEQLPAVSVEEGRVVYCRMRYCDFRFPLPEGARVVRTNLAGGGFDTIQGSVEIADSQGSGADLAAYARLLRKHGFRVNSDSGSSTLSASTADGGWVYVESGSIGFSYFGDY